MDRIEMEFPTLYRVAFTHPAIDNHAHPLLRAETRNELPFEGVISEAGGQALLEDAPLTLACFRATKQLFRLYGLKDGGVTWEAIKKYRDTLNYEELCTLCFKHSGISCILVDDGLGTSPSLGESYKWFDQFTNGQAKRLVRIESVAEEILKKLLKNISRGESSKILEEFEELLEATLQESATDPEVAGFKSIVCYRTGLHVFTHGDATEKAKALVDVCRDFNETGKVRLAHKPLNDEVVRIALAIAGQHGKPLQFHTGLGDNDLTLSFSSPAHLQPIIKAYPKTTFVILHSSYPYTREAGYLTSVYKNVYLDFGEIFPMVSLEGQRNAFRQVLELCPTNKIMWSSDGHWWPESYYLGILQARGTLYQVLAESVRRQEVSEAEAVGIVEKALYLNASKLYRL